MTANQRTALFFLLASVSLATAFHLTSASAQLLVSAFDKPSPETEHDLLTIQSSALDIVEKALPATVALELNNTMGSGVVISEDGYILTAAHVVMEPGRDMKVRFPDGTTANAVSLGLHTPADGALAKITDEGPWPFIPMVTKEQGPKIGDWCISMGHPGGYDENRGPPLRLGRIIDVQDTVIRTDCMIMGGDSGGPLIDMQGRVIGAHSRITESMTENYHVPALACLEGWDALLAGELYPEPVPSQFLTMLDANQDGRLTRDEQKSNLDRRVLDQLFEEFGLEENVAIEEVTSKHFKWREATQARMLEIEEVRNANDLALPTRDYVRGKEVGRIFERRLDHASDLTVRVYSDGARVALGLIVRSDGFLVTKASQLKDGPIECVMPDGERLPGTLVASNYENDLAMIQIPATDLPEPEWSNMPVEPGVWIAVPDVGGRLTTVPVSTGGSSMNSVGVVGVAPRKIESTPAMLGISVDRRVINEALVETVIPRGGAAEAGIQPGDVVVRVESKTVSSVEEIRKALEDNRAGDKVTVTVIRDGEEIKKEVILRSRAYIFYQLGGIRMGGRLSRRRDGFESVFQSDAALRPERCGGPVIDANGRIFGVTLARASRVATYAIGHEDLRKALKELWQSAEVELAKTKKMPEID